MATPGIDQRVQGKKGSPGPFLAVVTNHLDTTFMGRLEVTVIKGIPSNSELQSNTHIVKYLSPFYGVTGAKFQGNDPRKFDDVQKSYGMWMIPPDIGTTVMIIFIDGDETQGYWIGCVPDEIQNHMIPGIAASNSVLLTPEQERTYGKGLGYLPVAEIWKGNSNKDGINANNRKPVHPFADRLLKQGLLADTIRGVTSSSARREIPSAVFGISTPGPIDPNAPKVRIGYKKNEKITGISKLGGSTFVMDDGDIDGNNELVRIRTRTGHQILLHNSADLIYIGNGSGTAWLELTGSGKIDIYAADSISIHTDADFNLHANRDFNIEAGRNINLKTGNNLNLQSENNSTLLTKNINTIKGNNELSIISNKVINVKAPLINEFPGAPASFPIPPELPKYSLPNTNIAAGWVDSTGMLVQYKSGNIITIMKRVPTHEPYQQHESASDTTAYSATNTDASKA